MTSRMLSRRNVISAAVGAAGLVLLAAVPSAHAGAAPKPPTIELIVILASQSDGGGDDARIATLPDLKQAPLKFYNARKLLEKPQVSSQIGTDATAASKIMFTYALQPNTPVAIAVANGPTMTLTLTSVTAEEGKPPRYNISADLGSSRIGIVLSPLQRVFVGGPQLGSGTLFFGVHAKG
jgi:hypothetical protein